MQHDDPSVFHAPVVTFDRGTTFTGPAYPLEPAGDAAFGRNASKLSYVRQKAQVERAVAQTAQTQARDKARTPALQTRQTAPKETTVPTTVTMSDADRRRLLGSSVLGQEVLRHEQMQRAATFAKGSKYTREELAKLTPKDFADPVRLEYPILDQEDLDAAADAMLEAAKVPMLFDQEKDDRMRSQIRAIASRRGLRLPDHWRTSGLDERGQPIVPTSKHREALEASSLGREVLRQAPKG